MTNSRALDTNDICGEARVTPGTVVATVNSTPPGMEISVDGQAAKAPATYFWQQNTPHLLSVEKSTQEISTGSYLWSSWSDGGNQSHSVTPSVSTTYTAGFQATHYRLNISVEPSDGGTFTPPTNGLFAVGTSVPLLATAANGFSFSKWTGDVAAPASASTTILMNGPKDVKATFTYKGAIQTVAVATALQVGEGINLDVAVPPPGTPSDKFRIRLAGDLRGVIRQPFYPPAPPLEPPIINFNTATNQTNVDFDMRPIPLNAGYKHVGFYVHGNPGSIQSGWTNGSTELAAQTPNLAPDFRYSSQTRTFGVLFCNYPGTPQAVQLVRLQYAVVDLPLELDDLNGTALPPKLAAQSAALADMTPPSGSIAPGTCSEVMNVPFQVKEFQAVIVVAHQLFPGGSTATATRNFIQKIAKDADAAVCDANGDHVIDINDTRIILNRRNSKASANDRADFDRDGVITTNDGVACARLCLRPQCAP